MVKHERLITPEEHRAIKRTLGMPTVSTYARCPARDMSTVKKLEAQGEMGHHARGHVCTKCQCNRIAGQDTKGDFYGLGEHTGHIGVGFCQPHDDCLDQLAPGRSAAFARSCMHDQQRVGNVQQLAKAAEWIKLVEREGKAAEGTERLRKSLEMIQSRLLKLEEAYAEGKKLKERVGKVLVDMCDKTMTDQALKLCEALVKIANQKQKMESDEMVHRDFVKSRLLQTMSMSQRFIPDKETLDKWNDAFREIWSSLPEPT